MKRLLALTCIVGSTLALYAQGRPAVGLAEPGAPAHGFEVATVRLANRNDGRHWFGTKVEPSGRFSASAMSLKNLVWYAYVGTQKTSMVEGGPKWTESDEYDIEAKIDEADKGGWEELSDRERSERAQPLLRALLEERFKLKMHTETRVMPVYALVVAKGGVKMKEVPPPANADPQAEQDRRRSKTPTAPPGGFMVSDKGWVGSAVQIRALLGQIAYEVGATDHIMVDETGLDGTYDFTVKLSRDKDGPTLEQQIEDQMGLRVEQRKAPVDVYVIDSAERPELD
jgi:uncharacterized protein (TIGR03435 family)